VQNDWRVTPRLTLNLGLRYQYQSPRWEKFNRQGLLNLARLEPNPFVRDPAGNPLPGPVFEFAGVDGRSRYLSTAVKDAFEPRFGFAWVPDFEWNSRKIFVVRGGYGLTHGVLMGNDREPIPNLGSQTGTGYRQISYLLGSNDILSPNNNPNCGLARCNDPALPMQFGFNNPVLASDPSLFAIPRSGVIRPGDQGGVTQLGVVRQNVLYQATGVVRNENYRLPAVHNFSFQTEYALRENTVVRASYQGSRGRNLFGPSVNLNRLDQFTGKLPYPGFSGRVGNGIFVLDPTNTSSWYNAAVLEMERRFSRGLQFRVNYTFSKSMDDSSGGIRFPIPNNSFSNSALDFPILRNQNPFDPSLDRSVSSTNTPHIFNLVALWDLPIGRGKRFFNGGGWKDTIIGGWNLNGVSRMRSGFPMTVPLGVGNAFDIGTPGGSLRPDIIAGVPLQNPDWTRENAWRGVRVSGPGPLRQFAP
jgi:hypothetical protein